MPKLPIGLLIFMSMQKGRRGQSLRLRGYQIRFLEFLWLAWTKKADAAFKLSRQVGKTTIVARFVGYLIVRYDCSAVLASSKIEKTRKMARLVKAIMLESGRKMDTKGIIECRFEESEAGFICHSGRREAEREGDTADIIVIDEAQDVIHEAVWPDFSPMRSAVDGIIIAMGIGGGEDSVIETMFAESDHQAIVDDQSSADTAAPTMKMNLRWDEVEAEIPRYRKHVERDRLQMPEVIFDAHYNGKTLPVVVSALIPRIVPWEERSTDPFDYERADEVIIGTDWGKQVDCSASLAMARFGMGLEALYVLFSFQHYQGVGYDDQLDLLMTWQRGIYYTSLRPEENNVGSALIDFWRRRLNAEYNSKRIAEVVDPVYTSGDDLYDTLKRIATVSQQGRLLYVDDGQYASDCIGDLKKVGVKYLTGGRLKPTHSDWLSALVCCFYPSQKGVMNAAA